MPYFIIKSPQVVKYAVKNEGWVYPIFDRGITNGGGDCPRRFGIQKFIRQSVFKYQKSVRKNVTYLHEHRSLVTSYRSAYNKYL
jgi:hypothetical protein